MKMQPAILVVDDDNSIRSFVCTLLNRKTNVNVLDAANPQVSLGIARKMGTSMQVLLSDIDLNAGMNGIQLAREIVRNSPATKVVLMSGDHTQRPGVLPGWRFIPKPFALQDLVDTVNELLASEQLPLSA
jgi:DNA-binding NtrC family response regulator